MLVDYCSTKVFSNTLDIVDPGHTAIKCTTDSEALYFLIIETVAGSLNILKFGPISTIVDGLLGVYDVSFYKDKWNEAKLKKEISNFLNDPKKQIISAEECPKEEAFSYLIDIKEAYNNLVEEQF